MLYSWIRTLNTAESVLAKLIYRFNAIPKSEKVLLFFLFFVIKIEQIKSIIFEMQRTKNCEDNLQLE